MARPRRLPHFTYVGAARYSLTFCTLDRHQAFESTAAVALTLRQFRIVGAAEQVVILAYCFMPDHVHLLTEGTTQQSDLRRFARMARQRSGHVYRQQFHRLLWQRGYFERVLRATDDAQEVARYIVANPVRAGLVRSPADYPHLGSDMWTLSDLIDSVRRV